MSDLVSFLRARLDEDEAVANSAMGIWKDDGAGNIADVSYMAQLAIGPIGNPIDAASRTHILRHQPARVLREVQMKRTLLGWVVSPVTGEPLPLLIGETVTDLGHGRGTVIPETWILREMAAVYSDHPDYRQEWKP